MIHIGDETRTRLARWYNIGSYEERSKYDAVCTLIHVNSTTVVIEGLCGNNINVKFWKELRTELTNQGYTTALVERHGKWKTIMKGKMSDE